MTPGERLRFELKRLALKQSAVAAKLGLSRQSINNVINGRQQISRPLARKLGTLTGKASDYWLRDRYPDPPMAKIVRKLVRKPPKKKRQLIPIEFHAFVTKSARNEFDAELIARIKSDQKFRSVDSWAGFRLLLVRNGASDGDLVSARAAWKRYITNALKPTARLSSG